MIGQNTMPDQFVGSILRRGVAGRLEGRTAHQRELPVLGKWTGRTSVTQWWMESPSRLQTAAQAGGCLERNSAGTTLEAGTQQLSVDQQRALVAKDVNCLGILRAADREEVFTALGDLGGCICRTVFSVELHTTRKALRYWSRLAWSPAKNGRRQNARCKQKTGTETRRNVYFSAKRKEGFWEMDVLSSTTCGADGKGTEPGSSQSHGRRRSDKYWLEHKKYLLDEEIFTWSLMEPWRSRRLN